MRTVMLAWVNYSGISIRTVPGIIDSAIFQLGANPYEFMMAVVFENEETYRANSESMEQHEEYVRMLEFLVGPPEWHDGEVIWYD